MEGLIYDGVTVQGQVAMPATTKLWSSQACSGTSFMGIASKDGHSNVLSLNGCSRSVKCFLGTSSRMRQFS